LGDVAWTPVDSLTAQKRLVEAGLGIALLSQKQRRRRAEIRCAWEHRRRAISPRGMTWWRSRAAADF